MPVARGGGRWGEVFVFMDIFTKGFGFYPSRSFSYMVWEVYVLSRLYASKVSVEAWLSLGRGVGVIYGNC